MGWSLFAKKSRPPWPAEPYASHITMKMPGFHCPLLPRTLLTSVVPQATGFSDQSIGQNFMSESGAPPAFNQRTSTNQPPPSEAGKREALASLGSRPCSVLYCPGLGVLAPWIGVLLCTPQNSSWAYKMCQLAYKSVPLGSFGPQAIQPQRFKGLQEVSRQLPQEASPLPFYKERN